MKKEIFWLVKNMICIVRKEMIKINLIGLYKFDLLLNELDIFV